MSVFSRLLPTIAVLGTGTLLWADDVAPGPSVRLTNEEMRRGTEKVKEDAKAVQRDVEALSTRAENQKDIIKMSCVNDKLVEVKAQMNIADDQGRDLSAALEKGTDESQARYRDLTLTGDTLRKLREEAQACMGETEIFRLESGVEVTHPPIQDDPTLIDPNEIDGTIDYDPPGYASPFS